MRFTILNRNKAYCAYANEIWELQCAGKIFSEEWLFKDFSYEPQQTMPQQSLCDSHTGLDMIKNTSVNTHWVEEDSEEKLSSIYEFVQLFRASRILIVEDGVSKETTGLPG